jgi:hypothetical protein
MLQHIKKLFRYLKLMFNLFSVGLILRRVDSYDTKQATTNYVKREQ